MADLIPSDSVAIPEAQYAIILTPPAAPEPAAPRVSSQTGISFILCGIFILVLITALRFRNNIKYAVTLFKSLIETRTRQNVFDDTVRETSLIILLNILWCGCAGVICFNICGYFGNWSVTPSGEVQGICLGMLAAVGYTIFRSAAYWGIGWVFSDSVHASMWLRGFGASQGLMTPFFFLIALFGICNPTMNFPVVIASAAIYFAVKLVFIWKGYRIFFNQFSSWVLFLCYLCSLEIVPLILTYRIVCLLGEELW